MKVAVPLGLLIATFLTLIMGAITVLANSAGAPDSLSADEHTEYNTLIEKINVQESAEEPGIDSGTLSDTNTETTVTLETVWDPSPVGMSLQDRLIKALLRSRTLPGKKGDPRQFNWERCGIAVPEDALIVQANEWVVAFLDAANQVEKETGIAIAVWGAFATLANEGGFNECALNYEARKWASEHTCRVLTTETWKGKTVRRKIDTDIIERFQQTYDRETVWRILHDKHFKTATVQVKDRKNGGMKTVGLHNKADGGPWQIRFDVDGMTRKHFDALTSVSPGVYIGLREMARRAQSYAYRYRSKEPHPRPWQLWPGGDPNSNRSLAYDVKITSIARWLGARKEEIERGFMATTNP